MKVTSSRTSSSSSHKNFLLKGERSLDPHPRPIPQGSIASIASHAPICPAQQPKTPPTVLAPARASCSTRLHPVPDSTHRPGLQPLTFQSTSSFLPGFSQCCLLIFTLQPLCLPSLLNPCLLPHAPSSMLSLLHNLLSLLDSSTPTLWPPIFSEHPFLSRVVSPSLPLPALLSSFNGALLS